MKLICITLTENKDTLIYIKPDTCLIRNNEDFYLPAFSKHITLRLALVVKVKKMGKNISERFAHRYYDEISAGLNFEAADLLCEKQNKKQPWDEAVSFDRSAPLGTFLAKEQNTITLYKDNEVLQTSHINDFKIDALLSQISHKFTLKIGDFVYISLENTPKSIEINDTYDCHINDSSVLKCQIK